MTPGLRTLLAAGLAAGFALVLPPAAATAGEIRLTVTGVRDDQGKVMIALYDNPEAFTRDVRRDGLMLAPQAGEVKGVFTNVPSGTYAIAVYHDENNNGKLDYNLFGIPGESFGFSKDAIGTMGPPGFDAASFTVGAEGVVTTGITLR